MRSRPLASAWLCAVVVLAGCQDEGRKPPTGQPSTNGATCGNGKLDGQETCDPQIRTGVGVCPSTCDDGLACTADLLTGTSTACTAACSHAPVNSCTGADGCCPAGCNSSTDDDCSATCGNHTVEAKELCDGNCPADCNDGNACTADELFGAASNCSAACTHAAMVTCASGDGCCPQGCNHNSDNDCSATCGNGQVETGEACDGNCPASCDDGNACTSDQATGSAQTCSFACSHQLLTTCKSGDGCCPAGCTNANDQDCSATCGNGQVEAGEACDGNCPASCDDLNACTLDGRSGSASNCSLLCTHQSISSCANGDGCCPASCTNATDADCPASCGNGQREAGETCDGDCPASCADSNACTIDGSTGSAQNCTLSCTHTNISSCTGGDGCCPAGCTSATDGDCPSSCGNHALDSGETCDDTSEVHCPTTCPTEGSCSVGTLMGSSTGCNARCEYSAITICRNDDRCCPSGSGSSCTSANDNDCGGTSHGAMGDTCTAPGDCLQATGSADCMPASSWPGGYCSQWCTSGECPSVSPCIMETPFNFHCASTCSVKDTQSNCRPGYMCRELLTRDEQKALVCTPGG